MPTDGASSRFSRGPASQFPDDQTSLLMMICIGTESCSSRDDSKDSVQDRLISEVDELSAVLQMKAPLSMRLS